jgi:hypothetical protein
MSTSVLGKAGEPVDDVAAAGEGEGTCTNAERAKRPEGAEEEDNAEGWEDDAGGVRDGVATSE